jgi:NitT/TauT family transport system permease protein
MNVRTTLSALASYVLPPVILLAAIIGLWEWYIGWKDVSIIVMPPPTAIVERFADRPEFFFREAKWTVYEAMFGLVCGSAVAIGLAIAMAHSRIVERAVFPVAILVKVVPIVAIAPVLVIVLGFNDTPKIVVAALLSFFPMLVNGMTGFRDVNAGALEFMRSIRASTWHIFWKLRLPSSSPYIFSALKITFPLSLTGAVVAEWFTGDRGLGFVIARANGRLDTPTLFAAVGVLAIIGIALNIALSLLERRLLFWHESVRSSR